MDLPQESATRPADAPPTPGPGQARSASGPARGVVGLVTDPQFGGVFWGKFFSFAGVTIHTLVISVLAYDATGSTMAVALVNTALFVPQILLGPWSGAVSDRGWSVFQIVTGRSMCAVGVAALAVWLTVAEDSGGWTEVAVIAATGFVAGVGLAFGSAAMNSLVPQLVTRDEMSLAMSLNTAPLTVARVVGPVVGAFVLTSAGAVWALWIAAAGHFVFAAVVALVRPPSGPRLPRSREGSVGAAWRYVVREDRVLFRLLLGVAFVGFGSEPVFVLAPSYADALGGGTTDVGWLSASFGVGAAIGMVLVAVVDGRIGLPKVSWLAMVTLAVALVGCALAPDFVYAHVAFALAGLGFTLALGVLSTLVQLRVPPALRGRVMALWILGLVGARPFVSLLVGAVDDVWGESWAFATVAAALLSALWWLRPSRLT